VDNEFPSNSRRDRTEPPKTEVKKVEPVVTGEVVRRKRPLGKRLLETFIGGSARGVATYVMMDVLLPAAKDTIADAVSQGVERLIFGESRSTSRRTGYRPGGSTSSYTSYNRMSSSRPNSLARRDEEPRYSSLRGGGIDFDDIILATRVEAEEVVDRMFDMLAKYEVVTVPDLYDLLGQTVPYTQEKYGWTDLRGAGVTRITSGYLLDLPRPEQIK
jgi:hypothetical protein